MFFLILVFRQRMEGMEQSIALIMNGIKSMKAGRHRSTVF
jgi:hypothetical protein